MTAQEFANLLRGKRIKPGKYIARCPAHPDKTPSLAISEGRKGLLVHCWAGCDTRTVVATLGLRLSDLYYDAASAPDRVTVANERAKRIAPVTDEDMAKRERKYSAKGQIVARYHYTNSAGEHIATKLRMDPKAFLWRRADGNWGQPKDCPIYNLHGVTNADLVIVTEGEKDCDSLSVLGYTATTAPNGAASWRPEYAEYFRGKTVLVMPDNDVPGREYAIKVGGSLCGVARYVDLVEIPGAFKDVSEFLRAHRTDPKAALRALVEES
jgi:putative DNA primase/helicase